MLLKRIFPLLLLFLLLATKAEALVYWVSPLGSDSNNCFSTPDTKTPPNFATQSKRSIRKYVGGAAIGGISCLGPGDTLAIKTGSPNGIYDERLTDLNRMNNGQDGTEIPPGPSDAQRTTLLAVDGRDTVIIKPSVKQNFPLLTFPNLACTDLVNPRPPGGEPNAPFRNFTFDGIIFDGTNVDAGLSTVNNVSAGQIIYLNECVRNVTFNHFTIRNAGLGSPLNHNGVMGVLMGGMVNVQFLNGTFVDNGHQIGCPACNSGNQAAAYHVYQTGGHEDSNGNPIVGWGGHDTLYDNVDFIRSGGYSIHQCCKGIAGDYNTEIRNSRFESCGISADGPVGLAELESQGLHGGDQGEDTSCVVLGPTTTSIHHNVFSHSYGHGIGTYVVSFYNNVVYGSRRSGFQMGSNNFAKNNIIWGNNVSGGGYSDISASSSSTFSNFSFSNNLCGSVASNVGNGVSCSQTANPTTTFVDVNANPWDNLLTHKNFALTTASTMAIDQGASTICQSCGPGGFSVTIPQCGTQSPCYYGPAPDLGAFELIPGGPVAPTIAILTPSTTGSYITAQGATTVTVTGTATCQTGCNSITWVNDQGFKGGITGTFASWTAANIPLVTRTVNTITFTVVEGANSTIAVIAVSATGVGRLVLYYKFNENSGTSVQDSSGLNNNGQFTGSGITWQGGHNSSALSFSGAGGVTTPASSSLNVSLFTIEAWVFQTTANTGYTSLFATDGSFGSYIDLFATAPAGACPGASTNGVPTGGFFAGAGTGNWACDTVVLPLNTWRHIAVTYDGSNMRFYRSNAAGTASSLISTAAASGLPTANTAARLIGTSVFSENFIGMIDELRVYDKAVPLNNGTGDGCSDVLDSITRDLNCGDGTAGPLVPPKSLTIGSNTITIGSMTITIGE